MLLLLAAQEPWWERHDGLLGLIGFAVGTVLTVVFFLLQRDRKTLDWQIVTDETIVTPAAQQVT